MKTSNNNSIAHAQNRKRIVLAGVLVLLVAGFCLVILSGCSVLSAYAAQGEPGQTNQGVCRIYQDANNDGICDNCGSYCSGESHCVQGFVDKNNNGICDHRETGVSKMSTCETSAREMGATIGNAFCDNTCLRDGSQSNDVQGGNAQSGNNQLRNSQSDNAQFGNGYQRGDCLGNCQGSNQGAFGLGNQKGNAHHGSQR